MEFSELNLFSDLVFTLEVLGLFCTFGFIVYLLTQAPFLNNIFNNHDGDRFENARDRLPSFHNYALVGGQQMSLRSLRNQPIRIK